MEGNPQAQIEPARYIALFMRFPDVARNVRDAISRKRRMFDKYNDVDDDSLYNDVVMELTKAIPNYDPAKSAPGSFAFKVASLRLLDMSETRTRGDRNMAKAADQGEIRAKGGYIDSDGELDVADGAGEDQDIGDLLLYFHDNAAKTLKQYNMPIRNPHCRRGYPDSAQRLALYFLQERMGWGYSQAARELRSRPEALAMIGLSNPPSWIALLRAKSYATHIQKTVAKAQGLYGVENYALIHA